MPDSTRKQIYSGSWHTSVVALTGSIGSGKSTVAAELRRLGATVFDADQFAREVILAGTAAHQQILNRFGVNIQSSDGSIDRKALGAIVFADPSARKELEAITHPKIRELAERSFKEAAERGDKVIVYEVPLLFETGLDKSGFKKIITVTAPREVIVQRICSKRGLSVAEVNNRLDAQLDPSLKIQGSDYVIDNNGNEEELSKKVRELYNELAK